MRFMKFVLDYKNTPEVWEPYQAMPIKDFLIEKFKLEPQQVEELIYSIGLCVTAEIPTVDALARMHRYIVSLGVYGSFPALYVMYGSAGELVQAFSRSAAVAGAVYKLNTSLVSYDKASKTATLSDGGRIAVSEKLIISAQNTLTIPQIAPIVAGKIKTEVTRMVAIVSKDCKEWYAENEQAAIISFPPGSLPSDNRIAVQVIIYGGGSGMCPIGQSIWYLSSTEKGKRARIDLEEALKKLEVSILRESTEDFEFDNVDDNDVSIRSDGMPVLSSVKLGQSLQNFVPREKLQYLLKLLYTQATSTHENFELEQFGISVVSPPSSEITFDGIVASAVKLYEQVVGSDDDFFDIDFEDDDDDDEATMSGANLGKSGDISASSVNSNRVAVGDEEVFDSDDNRASVFADDMEL